MFMQMENVKSQKWRNGMCFCIKGFSHDIMCILISHDTALAHGYVLKLNMLSGMNTGFFHRGGKFKRAVVYPN